MPRLRSLRKVESVRKGDPEARVWGAEQDALRDLSGAGSDNWNRIVRRERNGVPRLTAHVYHRWGRTFGPPSYFE